MRLLFAALAIALPAAACSSDGSKGLCGEGQLPAPAVQLPPFGA